MWAHHITPCFQPWDYVLFRFSVQIHLFLALFRCRQHAQSHQLGKQVEKSHFRPSSLICDLSRRGQSSHTWVSHFRVWIPHSATYPELFCGAEPQFWRQTRGVDLEGSRFPPTDKIKTIIFCAFCIAYIFQFPSFLILLTVFLTSHMKYLQFSFFFHFCGFFFIFFLFLFFLFLIY